MTLKIHHIFSKRFQASTHSVPCAEISVTPEELCLPVLALFDTTPISTENLKAPQQFLNNLKIMIAELEKNPNKKWSEKELWRK